MTNRFKPYAVKGSDFFAKNNPMKLNTENKNMIYIKTDTK
jgi:hypothetical protein